MNFASIEELYDLKEDPWELHNLASEPAQKETIRKIKGMLLEHMENSDDELGHEWRRLF